MIRLKHLLVIGVISLLGLAGCNTTQQSTTQTSPTASPAFSVGAAGVTAPKEGFNSLLGVVSSTRAAVEAGNFAKAKAEFAKFEDNWKQVEDGVKAKSPASYKAIEDSLDQVRGDLKGSGPNKQKVLAALQALDKNITGVAKS